MQYLYGFSNLLLYCDQNKQVFRYLDVPGMTGQWEKNIKIGNMLCQKRFKTVKYQQVTKKEVGNVLFSTPFSNNG